MLLHICGTCIIVGGIGFGAGIGLMPNTRSATSPTRINNCIFKAWNCATVKIVERGLTYSSSIIPSKSFNYEGDDIGGRVGVTYSGSIIL